MTNRCAHEYLNTVPCKNSDTVCIQPSYVCDNYDDCGDNSDEEDCFSKSAKNSSNSGGSRGGGSGDSPPPPTFPKLIRLNINKNCLNIVIWH